MKRLVVLLLFAAASLGALAGCGSLDVVQTDAARAFGEVSAILAPSTNEIDWRIAAPDDSAAFHWNGKAAYVTAAAKPLVDAGLDAAKLDPQRYRLSESGAELIVGDKPSASGDWGSEAGKQFADYVKNNRDKLGFHTAMNHYNVNVGGAMFEWAKDLAANDKDIVFVLDPDPLVEAGLNPDAVDGWAYSEVETDDGKVWKLLKPFDLE